MFWMSKNYPFWLKGLAGWPDGMGWQAGRVGVRVGGCVGVGRCGRVGGRVGGSVGE